MTQEQIITFDKGYVVCDVETNNLQADELHMLGLFFPESMEILHYGEEDGIKLFLEECLVPNYTPIFHNANFDIKVIDKFFGVRFDDYEDTLIMSYIITPGNASHSLESWGALMNYPKLEQSDFSVVTEEMYEYNTRDLTLTWNLFLHLKDRFSKSKAASWCYENIDLPYTKVLYELNNNGVMIDENAWSVFSKSVSEEMDSLLEEMIKIAPLVPCGNIVRTKNPRSDYGNEPGKYKNLGQDDKGKYLARKWGTFSPGSADQMSYALNKLYGWTPTKKSKKTGKALINEEVLRELDYPLAVLYTKYAKLKTISSTFGDKMLAKASDGRLQPHFNSTSTRTGRLSCSNPNAQNIPSKGKYGALMRSFFVAPEGKNLVAIDFDSFQMRILAWYLDYALGNELKPDGSLVYPDSKALSDDFNNNENADPHSVTAKILFGDGFTKEDRRVAKTFNFGNLFGFGAATAAKATGLSIRECEEIIKLMEEKYPSLSVMKERTYNVCKKKKGLVATAFGRPGYYPSINSSNKNLKARAERQSFNFLIQGTEADIIKMYQIEVNKRLKELGLDSDCKFVLQIHDEIVFECTEEKSTQVKELLDNILNETEWLPGIKITGHAKIGKNWQEVK
jgi:DNA polymerase-1